MKYAVYITYQKKNVKNCLKQTMKILKDGFNFGMIFDSY